MCLSKKANNLQTQLYGPFYSTLNYKSLIIKLTMSTLMNTFCFYIVCITTKTDMEGMCQQTKFTVRNERIVTFFFTTRCGLVITDASEGDNNRGFTA